MKFKKSSKKILILSFGLSSIFLSSFFINTNNKNESSVFFKQKLQNQFQQQNQTSGFALKESQIEVEFDKNLSPTWKNKVFADTITNEQLKQMLVSNKTNASWYVKILPLKDDMIIQGYVDFLVIQNLINYQTGEVEKKYISPKLKTEATATAAQTRSGSGDNGQQDSTIKTSNEYTKIDGDTSATKESVWTTKNISGLILSKKFNFNWNTDENIGNFLRNNKITNLDSKTLLNNFVSFSNAEDILPKNTTASLSQTTEIDPSQTFNQNSGENTEDKISVSDQQNYGVGLLKISFPDDTKTAMGSQTTSSSVQTTTQSNSDTTSQNQQNTNWKDNKKPQEKQTSRIVRGITKKSQNEVRLNVSYDLSKFKNIEFDLDQIKSINPNFGLVNKNSNTARIQDFSPSELLNAVPRLTDLLATKTFLKNKNDLPPIYLEYMNKTQFETKKDSNTNNNNIVFPFYGTGLSHFKKVKIVDHNFKPTNKDTGEVSINNSIKIFDIQGEALDTEGTLKLKISYNTYDVYNNVIVENVISSITVKGLRVNKYSKKALFFNWKKLENLTFTSSGDLMKLYNNNLNNKDYLKDLSNTLFFGSNDMYGLDREVKFVQSGNDVQVRLLFENGNEFEKTFKFKKSEVTNDINFSSQEFVEKNIKNYKNLTPKQLIDKISSKEIDINVFFNQSPIDVKLHSSSTENPIIISSNLTNNGLMIRVQKNNQLYTNFYNGLKQDLANDFIYNISFNNEELSKKLYQKPLELITKQDIIDLYLAQSEMFVKLFDNKIDPEIITLNKDPSTGSINVKVDIKKLSISGNDQAVNTFSTTLKGFKSQDIIDKNSYVAPVNLTLPLSIGLGAFVIISLSITLIVVSIKRFKLSKKINNQNN